MIMLVVVLGILQSSCRKEPFSAAAYYESKCEGTLFRPQQLSALPLLRMSEKEQRSFSTEQLADLVVAFPFLIELDLYDTAEAGVQALAKLSDAYAALLKRSGAKRALFKKMESAYQAYQEDGNSEDYFTANHISLILMGEETLRNRMTKKEKERAYEICDSKVMIRNIPLD